MLAKVRPESGTSHVTVATPVIKLIGLLLDKGEMLNTEILAGLSFKIHLPMREDYLALVFQGGLDRTAPTPRQKSMKYPNPRPVTCPDCQGPGQELITGGSTFLRQRGIVRQLAWELKENPSVDSRTQQE